MSVDPSLDPALDPATRAARRDASAGSTVPLPPDAGGAPRAGLRGVLDVAGAGLPVVSFLARLPVALCPTGTLLLSTARSGIGTAGLVAGALWLGQAVGGPAIGRIADRTGQRRIVLATAPFTAVLLGGLAGLALHRGPLAAQILTALVAGLTLPQVGPLSRSRWIALVERLPQGRGAEGLVGRALSLDAVLDEVSFVAGPALAGLLAFAVSPAAGLLLAAALIAVFGCWFALHPSASALTTRRAAGPAPDAGPAVRPRVLTPVFAGLLVLMLLQGAVFGATNAGVNAMAAGDAGAAGPVWAVMGVTSAAAGLLIGSRFAGLSLLKRLQGALLLQALVSLPLLTGIGLGGVALTLAAMGLAVAPSLISVFGLAERSAAQERMGETMALLSSALIVGQGLGAPLAGRLAAAQGATVAFRISCGAAVLAIVTALLLGRLARRGPDGDQR